MTERLYSENTRFLVLLMLKNGKSDGEIIQELNVTQEIIDKMKTVVHLPITVTDSDGRKYIK